MQASPASKSTNDVNKQHAGATCPTTKCFRKCRRPQIKTAWQQVHVAFPLGWIELNDQRKEMWVFQSQSGTRSFPFILPPTRLSFSLSASSACRPLSSMSLRLTNCTSLSFDYTSKSSLSRLRRIYQEATSPFEENIAAQRRDDARPKPKAWHDTDFQNNLPLCWWRSSMANNYSK